MKIFDFNIASFGELDEYAIEKLVFVTDELSPILKGHIFIEKILETLISNNIPHPDAILKKQRLSFELKIDLARSLGLLPEGYVSAFKALNNVRNNYAHKDSYKVSIEELSGFKFDWTPAQNKLFKVAYKKTGVEEAARMAMIFLCWKAIHLIKEKDA